jgi:Methyltransferase small domain
MNGRDQYETPSELVAKMVASASSSSCEIVADFSAGDGTLLSAAAKRWPRCRLAGADVDPAAVNRLRRSHPAWEISRCDFLSRQSRDRSAIRHLLGRVPLVLLNPPFSGRGGTRWLCEVDGTTMRCSQALAFVLTSLRFLRTDGELVAILPTSCVKSDKDRQAWQYLCGRFGVTIAAENHRRTFNGCVAETILVHISTKAAETPSALTQRAASHDVLDAQKSPVRTELFRGKAQVHSATLYSGASGYPFVHSTNLKAHGVELTGKRIRTGTHLVRGPAVLLPRVGKPMPSKLAVYKSKQGIVLSDCVLAIKCTCVDDARAIHAALLKNWDSLSSAFSATCAPYITLSALCEVLRRLNVLPITPSTT